MISCKRSPYYLKLSGSSKARYDQKIIECGGIDPFAIDSKDLSTDPKEFPDIAICDIVEYMIHSVSPFTKRFLDNYKGTEAFRYFESGFVLDLGSKTINTSTIVKGTKSVTDILCKWNVPSFKQASMSAAKDITWKCPSNARSAVESSFLEYCDSFSHLSDETVDLFILKCQSTGDDPAISTLYSTEKKRRTKLRDEIFLANLYNEKFGTKSLPELIEIGKSISIDVTNDESNEIRKLTLPKLKSKCSVGLRRGRISGSNFKNCCISSIEDPSVSTLRRVINPIQNFDRIPSVKYQIRNKNRAIEQYCETAMSTHEDFVYSECGLVITSNLPNFVGSSDGHVYCSCHGNGCLEVKCLNIHEPEALDEFLTRKPRNIMNKEQHKYSLERNHEFFYKVQLEINLLGYEYCECVIWSPCKVIGVRVYADPDFWEFVLTKALLFHEQVVMPELLGKYYTEKIGLFRFHLSKETFLELTLPLKQVHLQLKKKAKMRINMN